MAKLLRFEFRKVFRSKYFYIITLIQVAFLIIGGLTTKYLETFIYGDDPSAPLATIYPFVKGALAGTFTLVLGIFVAIFACEDANQETSKSIISKGYKKVYVYFSKYIVSLIMTLLMASLVVISAFLFANAVFAHGEITDNLFVVISGQLLSLIAYHGLFFAISYSFNKPGAAIAINIIAPMGVSLLLTLGDTMLKNDNFKISSYWLDNVFSSFTGTLATGNQLVINYFLLVIYIAVAITVGALIANKKEIK